MEGEVCEVIGFNPNKVTRKLLAVEWKKLSEEEQIKVRAARSRRGVKCDICGSAGYYRENCPNSCQSPPRTPDSLATTPPDSPRVDQSPKALFWGSSSSVKSTENQTQHKKALQLKKPVSTDDVRPQAMMNLSTLKQSDEQLGSFGFYKKAGNAYATDYAQLTLHQVMRRMMRLLETHLRHSEEELTARHDSTLLHPPMDRPGKVCYPKEVEAEQEYRDYFINRVLKKDKKLRYKNQASLRPIDDLDPLFRGGDVRDDFLYKTNPNAGESMHAKNTWKSVLARHDILANSDPTLAKKQADLDKLFRNQSKWIANQQKSMMFKNDRFEHMVFILQSELKKEHARSSKMLEGNRKEVRVRKREVWNERLMSVDKLIALLNSYKFAAGLEEADFLMFCLDKWRDVSMREIEAARGEVQEDEEKCEGKPNTAEKVRKANGNRVSNDMIAAATNPYYPDTLFLEEYNKKNAKLHLKSKSGTVYSAAQQREQQASQKIEQLEKLKRYDSKLNARPGSRQQRAFHRHMTLPSLDDMLSTAQKEAEEFAAQDKRKADMLKRYEQMGKQVSADGLVIQRKRRVHPKEKDAQEISKMKKSFRLAGLASRIREGKDDDLAHALPALIPIPKAFDGDSKLQSYTADNIVYDIKKKLILSEMGYISQKTVPLYVRNTLEEKEGTSLQGDPTKEELAQDRRYSHYLGRPIVRFNPSVSSVHVRSPEGKGDTSSTASTPEPFIAADPFSLSTLTFPPSHKMEREKQDKLLLKELRKAQEEVRHLPITSSLVRMVFKNPEPTLEDLKYLDEIF